MYNMRKTGGGRFWRVNIYIYIYIYICHIHRLHIYIYIYYVQVPTEDCHVSFATYAEYLGPQTLVVARQPGPWELGGSLELLDGLYTRQGLLRNLGAGSPKVLQAWLMKYSTILVHRVPRASGGKYQYSLPKHVVRTSRRP